MTKPEFHALLDGLLRQPAGTIQGHEKLTDLGKWDSLAIIGFIALLDERFGVSVPAPSILACQTVADLAALAPLGAADLHPAPSAAAAEPKVAARAGAAEATAPAELSGRVFIVGAGGFGREVLCWLKHLPGWGRAFQFEGFLDDDPRALDGGGGEARVVGAIAGFAPRPDDRLVCAIGDPRTRLRIGRALQAKGGVFPVVRHPTSVVGEHCRLGAGTILCPGAIVTTNVTLGQFVIVNLGSTVGHDAQLGDGVTLSPQSDVTGFAVLGEGAFLGSHASVLPSATVGAYARVGAGSVVLQHVNAGATVMGVPAKQILP